GHAGDPEPDGREGALCHARQQRAGQGGPSHLAKLVEKRAGVFVAERRDGDEGVNDASPVAEHCVHREGREKETEHGHQRARPGGAAGGGRAGAGDKGAWPPAPPRRFSVRLSVESRKRASRPVIASIQAARAPPGRICSRARLARTSARARKSDPNSTRVPTMIAAVTSTVSTDIAVGRPVSRDRRSWNGWSMKAIKAPRKSPA